MGNGSQFPVHHKLNVFEVTVDVLLVILVFDPHLRTRDTSETDILVEESEVLLVLLHGLKHDGKCARVSLSDEVNKGLCHIRSNC